MRAPILSRASAHPALIFVTALANETYPLFRNLGKGLFQDITNRSRIATASLPNSGWSAGFYDFGREIGNSVRPFFSRRIGLNGSQTVPVRAGARLTGFDTRNSLALGFLLNTRGLVELIVLNVGLEQGILSLPLYSMMILMALVTTGMTTPLLKLVRPGVSHG